MGENSHVGQVKEILPLSFYAGIIYSIQGFQ
jgi:hypothetical protein